MISAFATWLRKSCHEMLSNSAPGQLATGLTLGMLIGLMPKSNVIVLSLCVALFSLRCDKTVGLLAAVLFSLASQYTDPFAHKVGQLVLGAGSMQGVYAAAFNMPLGPWLGFNNTVVTGSFLVGLYVAFPVYFVSRVLFTGLQTVFIRQPGERLGLDAEIQPGTLA